MWNLSGSAKRTIVVWVSGPALAPPATTADMHNVGRRFSPDLVVVPIGSSVRFPNDDPFYHSIYATDPGNAFDIGFYDTGPGKLVAFHHAGVVHVHCHIHVYMHGIIVVVDGPVARVSAGRYQFANLPAGRYAVHAVLNDGTERTSEIALASDRSLDLP